MLEKRGIDWERKKGKEVESVRERLSVRKRKAEVIDRCRDTLLRIMLVKGVESWTGKGSKTRKLQFIHQSFDWTRLRRPAKARGRDIQAGESMYIHCVGVRRYVQATTCTKCLANPGRRILRVHCTLENWQTRISLSVIKMWKIKEPFTVFIAIRPLQTHWIKNY